MTVYEGTPRAGRTQVLKALTFRRGRPPQRWFVVGNLSTTSGEIFRTSSNSIMSMYLTGALDGIPIRDGKRLAPIEVGRVRVEDTHDRPLPALIDGRARDIQAALRRLAPGKYRLAMAFTFSWDEHTDGPTWDAGSREAARGEIPLLVTP